jgi:hypothetical protein
MPAPPAVASMRAILRRNEGRCAMKKISVRKAAAIRLTAPCECHYSAFSF